MECLLRPRSLTARRDMMDNAELLRERGAVRSSVADCRACSLVDGVRSPVPFRGPAPCDVAVVGEAPGKVEDEQGEPFVGPSGELAARWVGAFVGLEVAWLNAVSCYPKRTPTKKEVDICRVNLHSQLAMIRPRLLLVFGGVAVSSWLSDTRIGEVRGRWWRANVTGLDYHPWAMATWHPAAVLRNRQLEVEVVQDLAVFRECVRVVDDERLEPWVDQTCVKCGSVVGTHVTPEGIAWCGKHWSWKQGTAGKGRPSKQAATKPKRSRAKPEPMF